jgi:hypothetical protein
MPGRQPADAASGPGTGIPHRGLSGAMSTDIPPDDPARPGAQLAPESAQPTVLDQPFDAGTLYLLRQTVLAHAVAAVLPEPDASNVVLAIHELAANVVRHGGGTGRLQMSVTPDAVC